MMGILGPYSPFLVGGSGLSFRGGGSKLLQGGGSLRDPSGGADQPWPPPVPTYDHHSKYHQNWLGNS